MIKATVFDLDGTIYLGNNIIDGALETISFLKEKHIQVLFFTNNSTKTRVDFFKKLAGMGIFTSLEMIYSSAYATAYYLKNNAIDNVFCLGTGGLQQEIKNAGVTCVNDEYAKNVGALVVGFDLEFTYQKLASSLHIFHNNAKCKLIVCNRDRYFPVENGRIRPACGPIVAAVESCAGHNADMVIGKPETYMIEMVCRDWNLANNEILVVGDSYESDIVMAHKFGSSSVFINSEDALVENTISISKIKELLNLENFFN